MDIIEKIQSLAKSATPDDFRVFLESHPELASETFAAPDGTEINLACIGLMLAAERRDEQYAHLAFEACENEDFFHSPAYRKSELSALERLPKLYPLLKDKGLNLSEGWKVGSLISRHTELAKPAFEQGFRYNLSHNGESSNANKLIYRCLTEDDLDTLICVLQNQPRVKYTVAGCSGNLLCLSMYNRDSRAADYVLKNWRDLYPDALNNPCFIQPILNALKHCQYSWIKNFIKEGGNFRFIPIHLLLSNDTCPELIPDDMLDNIIENRDIRSILISFYPRRSKNKSETKDFVNKIKSLGIDLNKKPNSIKLSKIVGYMGEALDHVLDSSRQAINTLFKPFNIKVKSATYDNNYKNTYATWHVEIIREDQSYFLTIESDWSIDCCGILADLINAKFSQLLQGQLLVASSSRMYVEEPEATQVFWTLDSSENFKHYPNLLNKDLHHVSNKLNSSQSLSDLPNVDESIDEILAEAQYKTADFETGFLTTFEFYKKLIQEEWLPMHSEEIGGFSLSHKPLDPQNSDNQQYRMICTINGYSAEAVVSMDTDYLNMAVFTMLNDALRNGAQSDQQYLAYNTPNHGTDFVLCCGTSDQLSRVMTIADVQVIED